MQPVVNLFAVLNLLGAAQSLLLALALVSVKRGNRTANALLAIIAATVSALITWNVLFTTHYILLFPHLLRLTNPLDFVAGPLLYLYIRTLTSRAPAAGKRGLLHFIPFGLCVLYLLPYYFQSGEYKLNIFHLPTCDGSVIEVSSAHESYSQASRNTQRISLSTGSEPLNSTSACFARMDCFPSSTTTFPPALNLFSLLSKRIWLA